MPYSSSFNGRIKEENLHIECKLQLGFGVRVINFEQSVDKFFQVYVAAGVEIEHRKEPFAYYPGKLAIL